MHNIGCCDDVKIKHLKNNSVAFQRVPSEQKDKLEKN